MCEVAMLHRPSRTLLLVDVLENFTNATPGVNWLVRAFLSSSRRAGVSVVSQKRNSEFPR
jgi:hypothetical protein